MRRLPGRSAQQSSCQICSSTSALPASPDGVIRVVPILVLARGGMLMSGLSRTGGAEARQEIAKMGALLSIQEQQDKYPYRAKHVMLRNLRN